MSLSLEQVGAVLLALVILFAAGRLWYALGDGEGRCCPPLFFRKTGALASPAAG